MPAWAIILGQADSGGAILGLVKTSAEVAGEFLLWALKYRTARVFAVLITALLRLPIGQHI